MSKGSGGQGSVPDIPDLDLPAQSTAPRISAKPAPSVSGPPPRVSGGPPPRVSARPDAAAIEVSGLDELDMEIERGGAMTSAAPAMSSRSGAPRPSNPDARVSGIEVSYSRMAPRVASGADAGPSMGARIAGYAVVQFLALGLFAALVKVAHRPGRSLVGLAPHAFDATSVTKSAIATVAFLVLAIAIGYFGVKRRAYAFIAAGAMALVTSLAMVTVTLVATDEHPTPADGALLVPYLVPLGLLLLCVGIAGRGVRAWLVGGSTRGLAVAAGLASGVFLFLAIEFSRLATFLP